MISKISDTSIDGTFIGNLSYLIIMTTKITTRDVLIHTGDDAYKVEIDIDVPDEEIKLNVFEQLK